MTERKRVRREEKGRGAAKRTVVTIESGATEADLRALEVYSREQPGEWHRSFADAAEFIRSRALAVLAFHGLPEDCDARTAAEVDSGGDAEMAVGIRGLCSAIPAVIARGDAELAARLALDLGRQYEQLIDSHLLLIGPRKRNRSRPTAKQEIERLLQSLPSEYTDDPAWAADVAKRLGCTAANVQAVRREWRNRRK